jgi:plasmid stabilization system protein ParE
MIVVYRPEAVDDLRRIARWYRRHRPEGEARFFVRFRSTMRRIEDSPSAFPRTSVDDVVVHKARVLRSPYSIAFTSDLATVTILAVIHGSRAPGIWMRRLRKRP